MSQDINDVKKYADRYAYELRKFFPTGESPLSHFICENEVIVISTKKLYIYFCDSFIDFKQGKLTDITIDDVNLENKTCAIELQNRVFNLTFTSNDLESLIRYHEKYKN